MTTPKPTPLTDAAKHDAWADADTVNQAVSIMADEMETLERALAETEAQAAAMREAFKLLIRHCRQHMGKDHGHSSVCDCENLCDDITTAEQALSTTAGNAFLERFGKGESELKPRNGHTWESLTKMWEDGHIAYAQLQLQLAAEKQRASEAESNHNDPN